MPIDDHELRQMAGNPWIHPVPPTCPHCGYNLTGLTSRVCPECGEPIRWRQVEQLARDWAVRRASLEALPFFSVAGLAIAAFGLLLVLVNIGFGGSVLLGAVGFLCALAALGVGLNTIVRIVRVPAWMRAEKPKETDCRMAAGAVGLALLVGVLSVLL